MTGHEEFRKLLFDNDLLFESGVDGIYGRSAAFQSIADGLNRRIARWAQPADATVIHLPPVVAKATFDQTNYLESFPDLVGCVEVFDGDAKDHAALIGRVEAGQDWSELLCPADVVLSPAVCHSVYPRCSGRLEASTGRFFDVRGICFRNEPSVDPARMRSFEMHELVFVGDPSQALAQRDKGLADGLALLADLGLDMRSEIANDPFFGRLGQMLADEQLDAGLKIEGVSHIYAETATALLSSNYHRDHFGKPFGIETAEGAVAHSACTAFGIDRIALALLRTHGLEPARWPASVRTQLWP